MASNTSFSKFVLEVKEDADGHPSLMFQFHDSIGIDDLDKGLGFLSLRFAEGTSYEQAQDVARYIERNVDSLSFTNLRGVR
jgi:hypothetical protein